MHKICTSLEQSKKLIELGIDVNTADMRYGYIAPYDFSDRMYDGGYDKVPYPKDFLKKNPDFSENQYDGELPAWSLSALMNLLPSEFTEVGEYSETTYKIDIRKYALTDDVDIYQIAYGNYHWHEDGSCSWSDMINSSEKEELIDAVFQMVVWLLENEKLINYR